MVSRYLDRVRPLGSARARRAMARWCAALALALARGSAFAASADSTSEPVITVDEGRVTVEVNDMELADVLATLADRADFDVETTGPLGRVTAGFTATSVEEALRRLVQDHEMMLIYGAGPDGGEPRLVQVEIFAGAPSPAARAAIASAEAAQRTSLLREIRQLSRARHDPNTLPRLTALAASADPTVRARAIWALGRVGGSAADDIVTKALSDSAPAVRVQAIRAMRGSRGAAAIPVVGSLLMSDPDLTVRRAAARMLRTMGSADALAALSAAANDQDPVIRREAERALNRTQ